MRLIAYTRGAVTILNRAGLEAASCEDYQRSPDEYTRLLGPTQPSGTEVAGVTG